MDFFYSSTGLIVIGWGCATNRPYVLYHPCLRRAVSIEDSRCQHALPRRTLGDPQGATPRLCRSPDISPRQESLRRHRGWSALNLANLVNESALLAARRNHDDVGRIRLRRRARADLFSRRTAVMISSKTVAAPPITKAVMLLSGSSAPPRPPLLRPPLLSAPIRTQGLDHSAWAGAAASRSRPGQRPLQHASPRCGRRARSRSRPRRGRSGVRRD